MKYAGAGYLTWLALGMLRSALRLWRTRREQAPAHTAAERAGAAGERPYRRAFALVFGGTRLAAASACRRRPRRRPVRCSSGSR